MKLICTQENFKKAIFNSERVVSKQSTLPILNNLLFEGGKGGLKISATNLEIGVSVKIGAKVEKEGKITVPAKIISSFINNLPSGENVALEISEQNLKIKSGNSKAVVKGLPADDFPLLPKKSTEFVLFIPGKRMRDIVNKIISCAAFNEARAELTGINVIFGKDEIFFAATDGFRLGEEIFALGEENVKREEYELLKNKKESVIIPANTLIELLRVLQSGEDSEVKIAIEDGQIFFEIDGTTIISRLINGKYPEYKHIMPKEYKTRAVGEKNMIQGSVKMASIFSNGKTSEIVFKIVAEEKKAMVEARSVEVGENSSELKLDVVGPSQEVVFNSKYLLDGLNAISTSRIAVCVNNSTTAVALKEIDEQTGEVLENYTYIVMPIKN